MKRSKEELGRIHKERCRELKGIRAQIAQDLGIELHQTECTYEGYCSGTCPKCRSEELRLNAAMLKKQLQEADLKRRVAAAGLTTVVALGLTGCDIGDVYVTEGTPSMPQEEVLEGDVIEIMDSSESTEGTEDILMGEMPLMTDEITGEE